MRLNRIVLTILLAGLVGSTALALAVAGWLFDLSLATWAGYGLVAGLLVCGLLWVTWRLVQRFLWRVGRRLAFSYFLIGVLPIPMVGLLLLFNVYLLAGYFLSHLYRDAVRGLEQELTREVEAHLAHQGSGVETGDDGGSFALAYYREGRREGGDARFPETWPLWLEPAPMDDEPPPGDRQRFASFVALPDGRPTIAVGRSQGRVGVVGIHAGDLESELGRRSDVWVTLLTAEDPRRESRIRIQAFGKQYALLPVLGKRTHEDRAQFFGSLGEDGPLSRRPVLWWGELAGELRSLDDGSEVSEFMVASLNGNLEVVHRHLFSRSAEVDTAVWAGLIAVTGLLSSVYALAISMAFYMIFSLSRAVNQMSRATDAVRGGDFSARIPVRRRDQIGDLHRSFNQMTGDLEQLVVAVAQKESLERELEIARKLQQSLLPADLPTSEAIDFATLFEPSAAIGGDYFDILRLDEDRLVVVIADVSGHGLPTGLRMAMLKAALVILVEERKEPVEIFRRLSAMVRSERERRFFVTSTIAVVDFRRGEVELTNAGHPPTYLLRRERVEEILLPGNPLGALGENYGQRRVALEPGDAVVWLSDGLIEVPGPDDEPFGYERVEGALAGPATTAAEVRNRLVAATEAHATGQPAEDDKTLVVMRYRSVASSSSSIPRNE